MELNYIKSVLLAKIEESRKYKKIPATHICKEIGVPYSTFNDWKASEKGSIEITEKLIQYFNLKLVNIY